MRVTFLALLIAAMPALAWAGGGALSRGSTAGHLESPSYNVIGRSSRVTTIKPRQVIAPAGAIHDETQDLKPGSRRSVDEPLLLERRLDCFSGSVAPDRDTRNRFTSRCPGNSR